MTTQLPVRTDDVPQSLLDVADMIGLPAVQQLMEHFGGLEIRVPVHVTPEHELSQALGEAAAQALCDFLGGSRLYVPHGRPKRSARADILALEAQGLDRATIARALSLSERHVRRVANGPSRPDDAQLGLFDED